MAILLMMMMMMVMVMVMMIVVTAAILGDATDCPADAKPDITHS